jgi:uncharacterized protein YndB with AHSA1/START domain
MPDEHAVLLERDGRSTLRFERLLPHPRERVWSALTERDELGAWHPTPFSIEADGVVAYLPADGAPELPTGRLLAIEPPRLLVHSWGGDELRWTLQEHEQGCLLTLEHSFGERFKAARDGAGWHLCLHALCSSLATPSAEQRADPPAASERLPDGWAELNDDYQRRFGIAPEQATPIPPM